MTHAGPKSAIDGCTWRQPYSPKVGWISYPSDGYTAALLALAQLHGAEQLPAKYVIDGDGRSHEPSAAEIRRAGS